MGRSQILFVFLLLSSPLFAQEKRIFAPAAKTNQHAPNWREHVTYEQFEKLIQKKVREIPELKPLWTWRKGEEWAKAPRGQEVYFGGGRLRGLVRWIEEKLSRHSLQEVSRLDPPSLEDLGVIESTDQDLFIKGHSESWLSYRQLPGNDSTLGDDWDILGEDFYQDSIKAGGADIEKVRVAIRKIEDPRGALRSYYEGHHSYTDAPESDFARFRSEESDTLNENSKLALIFRFLRFANDLPGATILPATRKRLIKIARAELPKVVADNYWIQKSLKKLHQSFN